MDGEMNLIEMELREILMKEDVMGGRQVIVLGEKGGVREFPIYIGYAEALALDLELHEVANKRPMTHDLIFNVLDGLGGEIQQVIVDDLREGTFFGKLIVRTAAGTEELIDSRPSDAVVLATKRKLPIFVNEEVLEKISDDQE